MPVMPKGRYKIMTDYMPKVGTLGLDMMYRTCTVQTNHDFSSEADMVKKLRVGARAAAGRDRAVRQLAVHRRQAERLPVVPLRNLARHRQRARRHAAVGVRARHGLRALRRLRARRADVFRQARRQLHRRVGQLVPRSSRRQAACPASAPPCRTGPTTSRRFFRRCGSSATSRCAAPTAGRGAGCRRCRRSGSACSTTTTASTPAGTSSRTGPRRSARSCATTCRSSASRPTIRGRSLLDLAQRDAARSREQGLVAPQAARPQRPRRDALSAAAARRSSRAASRRPRRCWRSTTARGTARSSRSSRIRVLTAALT